jgi:hypothetical protein
MRPASAGWKIPLLLVATLLFAGLCLAPAREAGQGAATAGWAEVEITPPLGIALGGRGGAETLASKVIDPLYAQVLYLKDGKGTGFVLASFDLIGLPHDLSDRIRTRMVHELGVDWNLVVLNTSHTHSGPYMLRSLMAGVGPPPQIEIDYFNALEEKIVAATRMAAKALRPVEAQVFQGTTRIGINRRGKNEQGRTGILPDPKGPFDEKVWTLRLTPKDGGPPAVVFSCACHPVIVYGYAFAALSADFPGATRKLLRESLGPKAHAQFVQGFAGNIRPRILADLDKGRFRASKPGDVDRAARELADAVLAALKTPGERLSGQTASARTLREDASGGARQYQRLSSRCERLLAQTLRDGRRLCARRRVVAGPDTFGREPVDRAFGRRAVRRVAGQDVPMARAIEHRPLGLQSGGEILLADGINAGGRGLRGAGIQPRAREHARAVRAGN